MRDLLSGVINYAWPSKWRHASDTINDICASCGIISPQQAVIILYLNDLLDGDLCKNIFYFHSNPFFWFSNMILSDALILPVSQLQTQQVMTSQIRSRIEYLIQAYYILLLIL